MRITVLTSSYPRYPGDSAAPFVRSIAEHLARQGHDVAVVAPHDPDVQPMEHEAGVRLHRFKYVWPHQWHIMGHGRALYSDVRLRPLAYLLLPLFLVAEGWTLLRVARQQKSQAIYVHWIIPNGWAATLVAALLRIPLVVSLHGSDIFVAERNLVFRTAARLVFRRAAAVTACSSHLREAALQLGAPADTLLIPWGADPHRFSPSRRSEEGRHAWGLSPSNVAVVALGRMVPKKGFSTLIEAFAFVAKECPHARLLVGGDGAMRNPLIAQAEALGLADCVRFPGRIAWEEVPGFLAAADVFVLPSMRDEAGNMDALPTVLLEAMGSGTAVVASAIGGVPLVVAHGQTGVLIPPANPQALSAALVKLIAHPDLRRALGQAARKAVIDRLNWGQVAEQLSKVIRRSVFRAPRQVRVGTIYRDEMVRLLDKRGSGRRVLDVGCYDGFILSHVEGSLRVAVDLDPQPVTSDVWFVQADATALPFCDGAFDIVLALDAIEHVVDDDEFAQSLNRVLGPGGQLLLSTPSLRIQLFPPFLTNWISRRWGHVNRQGYSRQQLRRLFAPMRHTEIMEWNAPAYRFFYLGLRLLAPILPDTLARLVRCIARWDARRTLGNRGFYVVAAFKTISPGDANWHDSQA